MRTTAVAVPPGRDRLLGGETGGAQDRLGTDWRSFRRTFIDCGGDGLYGATSPVHLEPVFQTLRFYGAPERAPHFDPRYRGSVKGYENRHCPNVERVRRRLCLFKTSMQTLEKVEAETAALAATIRHYASRTG